MPRAKLTKKLIDSLEPLIAEPGKDNRVIYWDEKVVGLGLVVHPKSPEKATGKRATGKKVFILKYRNEQKRTRKLTLGTFGKKITLEQARKAAIERLGTVAGGKDPAAKRDRARKGATITELADEYVELYAKPRKRTWADDKRFLQTELVPKWGTRKAASINRQEAIALLDKIVERGSPISANRTLSCARKMYSWALRRDMVPANPFSDIDKPAPEKKRERVLIDDELKVVLKQLPAAKMSEIARLAVRFLILTAQRSGEVMNLEWNDLDLDAARWHLPGAKTKNGQPHVVPLSSQAINIINKAEPLSGGEYVFSTDSEKPMVRTTLMRGIRRSEQQKEPVFDLREPWTIHDLRRSGATAMARLGVAEFVIDRVLNHSERGTRVSDTYNQYGYEDEKREALKKLADHLDKLMKPKRKRQQHLAVVESV